MARPRIYQRKFLIKREFQWKFILIYALTVSGIVGLTTYVMYLQIAKAVERQLYSIHIHVEKVGDLLLSLMFNANFAAILAIILIVMAISLGFFRKLNRHFGSLEQVIFGMAQGDFADAPLPNSRFLGIARLNRLLAETRTNYRDSFSRLEAALAELEKGCAGAGDTERLQSGQRQLAAILNEISIEK